MSDAAEKPPLPKPLQGLKVCAAFFNSRFLLILVGLLAIGAQQAVYEKMLTIEWRQQEAAREHISLLKNIEAHQRMMATHSAVIGQQQGWLKIEEEAKGPVELPTPTEMDEKAP